MAGGRLTPSRWTCWVGGVGRRSSNYCTALPARTEGFRAYTRIGSLGFAAKAGLNGFPNELPLCGKQPCSEAQNGLDLEVRFSQLFQCVR